MVLLCVYIDDDLFIDHCVMLSIDIIVSIVSDYSVWALQWHWRYDIIVDYLLWLVIGILLTR